MSIIMRDALSRLVVFAEFQYQTCLIHSNEVCVERQRSEFAHIISTRFGSVLRQTSRAVTTMIFGNLCSDVYMQRIPFTIRLSSAFHISIPTEFHTDELSLSSR